MPILNVPKSYDFHGFTFLRCSSIGIVPQSAYQRAFLAQRRGHGRAVARKLLIRAGGLKTCWTKPQGAAVPQLWVLQHGGELRGTEKMAAKSGDRPFERMWCRVEGADDVSKRNKIALETRGEAAGGEIVPFA